MQVRRVHSAVGANGADLPAAHNLLPLADQDFVKMSVDGIRRFHLLRFEKDMPHDDQISPTHSHVASQDDNAICCSVNGFAQVAIASLKTVPILTHVVVWAEAARGIEA